MAFLNAFGTVSRRGRWRRRLHFWDHAVGAPYDITDATLSLTLFPERTDRLIGCELLGPTAWAPPLILTSDDGLGRLLPDGANHGVLDVSRDVVATVRPGLYRASVVATYLDGSVVEVLSDGVRFVGPGLAAPLMRPLLTVDSGLPVDSAGSLNGTGGSASAAGPSGVLTPEALLAALTPEMIQTLLPYLPTSLPSTPGVLWNDGGWPVFS